VNYSNCGKRLFDLISTTAVLVVIFPILAVIAIAIKLTSPGPVFYLQKRVGINGKIFSLYKFRTMHIDADQRGPLITVGMRDPRISTIGYYLRRFKIDELPQLFNILKGEMSVVGPRPEVERYVAFYNQQQRKVLTVKPGLTDYASIMYVRENELLANSPNPEKTYIEEIMPEKLKLGIEYIDNINFLNDLKIIFKTLKVI
jgi:lipopolysaccharide/colanic/teichoic acid biosynthesis glycosyltransferase